MMQNDFKKCTEMQEKATNADLSGKILKLQNMRQKQKTGTLAKNVKYTAIVFFLFSLGAQIGFKLNYTRMSIVIKNVIDMIEKHSTKTLKSVFIIRNYEWLHVYCNHFCHGF